VRRRVLLAVVSKALSQEEESTLWPWIPAGIFERPGSMGEGLWPLPAGTRCNTVRTLCISTLHVSLIIRVLPRAESATGWLLSQAFVGRSRIMAKALFPKHSPGSNDYAGVEDLASEDCNGNACNLHCFFPVSSDFSRARYWRLHDTRKQAKTPSDGLASSITAWVRGNQISPRHFPTAFGGVRDYSSNH
jgi:hypothetical protein